MNMIGRWVDAQRALEYHDENTRYGLAAFVLVVAPPVVALVALLASSR